MVWLAARIETDLSSRTVYLLEIRVLMSGMPQPEVVDPLLLKLADLAAQSIDNRVGFFLQAKDVLTLDQKRLLAHMMGLD